MAMRIGLGLAAAMLVVATPLAAQQVTGAPARDFKLTDMDGKTVQLSQYKGKTVVLEWNNPGCPFVKKHYDSGNMQKTQAAARRDGAVWLTINSGAPGKQGHMTGAEARAFVAAEKATPTDYLLDAKGVVGKTYAAKTTPHMYVIAPDGTLAYAGGIDDVPTANPADIAKAQPLVKLALADVQAGKPVGTPTSRPYGCSVKY